MDEENVLGHFFAGGGVFAEASMSQKHKWKLEKNRSDFKILERLRCGSAGPV